MDRESEGCGLRTSDPGPVGGGAARPPICVKGRSLRWPDLASCGRAAPGAEKGGGGRGGAGSGRSQRVPGADRIRNRELGRAPGGQQRVGTQVVFTRTLSWHGGSACLGPRPCLPAQDPAGPSCRPVLGGPEPGTQGPGDGPGREPSLAIGWGGSPGWDYPSNSLHLPTLPSPASRNHMLFRGHPTSPKGRQHCCPPAPPARPPLPLPHSCPYFKIQ